MSFAAKANYGAWRVVGELGQGGMGRVFAVERQAPKMQAALKVLPPHSCGEEERRRFRREQEILASLEHPNIARFLDADETEDGELYLVLEKVEGLPIDRYCAHHGLALPARIELFLALCRAVAAANNHLIIHCDIKPSNVLVRSDGVVKLLDFGLARLAQDRLATRTLLSSFSTWAYASPEQLAGKMLTTASDVYSLGVVFFELLTGRRPFDHANPALLAQLEARDARPRVTSAGFPARLGAGGPWIEDLDDVVAKALRPDPEQRYASVDDLIADLEACLQGRPVAARRGQRRYALKRFVSRNLLAVVIAALLVGSALAATVVLAVATRRLAAETQRANLETDRAERISAFLLGLMRLSADSPSPFEGRVRNAVDMAVQRFDVELAGDELAKAQVASILGSFYSNMGQPRLAMDLHRQALEIWRQEQASDALQSREMLALALALARTGSFEEARALASQGWDLARRQAEPAALAEVLSSLGVLAYWSGELDKARSYSLASLRLQRHLYGDAGAPTEVTWRNLWRIANAQGDLALEERYLRMLLEARRERLGFTLDSLGADYAGRLALVLLARDEIDEAEGLLREAVAVLQPQTDPRDLAHRIHPGDLLLQSSEIARRRGRMGEAIAEARQAVELLARDLPPDDGRHGLARGQLARCLFEVGQKAEARRLWDSVRAGLEDRSGQNVQIRSDLAKVLKRLAAGQ